MIKRKCVVCHKELNELEGHPETLNIPASPSFRLPSGGVLLYCDKCYKEHIEGYKELNDQILHKKEKDKTKLYKKVLAKIKKALEKDAKEITIIKEEEHYIIRYKYK